MKAMVLAAGLGTRLRPLSLRWPKPAMPFLGQPLIRYTLAVLKRAGVSQVGFNTHHLPDVMEATARAEARALGLAATSVHEPVIQGTGGGIRGLKPFLATEEVFVVFNGDILFAFDLSRWVEEHRASGAAATLLLLPMPKGEKYAAVEADPAGRVLRIAGEGPGGKELWPWHFTGVHIMSPVVFDFMKEGIAEDINREVYPRLMAKGLLVRGAVVDGSYWSDLGTCARYLATQRDALDGRIPFDLFGESSPWKGAAPGSAPGVRLKPGARVEGELQAPALLDARARIAAGARVGPHAFLGASSEVQGGARVEDAAVLEGTTVRAGEALEGAIAWGQERLFAAQ